MRNLFVTVVLLVALSSCATEQNQAIELFNGVTFDVKGSEKIRSTHPDDLILLNTHIGSSKLNIPLTRSIISQDYTMLLGLPVGTTIKEISGRDQPSQISGVISSSDSLSFDFLQYDNGQHLVTRYVKNMNSSLFYLIVFSNRKNADDSNFAISSLDARFNNKTDSKNE